MSSNTYTLKIDIDDSKIRELEKRLMAIMGGKTAGLSGVAGAATGKSDKGSMMKNIAKLGVIALGVGSLVGLVSKLTGMIVDSSPMLKGMLKLLNYSVMLILRPIGDFFGFFLRPIIIYFMRSIALPWYKQMRPIMQALGSKLGVDWMRRTEEINNIGSNNTVDTSPFEIGNQNLEKTLLHYASFLDIFGDDEFQYEETKKAIANLKAAFAYIENIKVPTVDLTFIKTALEGITVPNISLSGIQTRIASAISLITLPLSLSGIQDKINTAITAITDYDFESLMTTVGNKIKSIWDGIFEKIYEFLPWLRPEETKTTTTQETLPPYAGSLEHIFGNNNEQNTKKPEQDPFSMVGSMIQNSISETLKGWGLG
jgi:hypothetical protein